MSYDEAIWEDPLSMADSGTRASVLVAALKSTPDPEGKRALLTQWFNLCDALRPWAAALREQAVLAGYFTDEPETVLKFPVTVYRGAWSDDDIENALSWTLDRREAERFCQIISGPRGMFLGMHRDDVEAYVWKAWCPGALGYINGRGEQEVIVSEVISPEPISALRTVGA